jgi:subfamily B ATP-binding cassette protein MsbA
MRRLPTFRRLLGYVRPYTPHLGGALACLAAYSVAASAMLYLVKPLFAHLFEGGAVPGTVQAPSSGGLFSSWRQYLDAFIEDLIASPTVMGTLERVCLLIIAATVFKALFFYLQGYLMAHLHQGVVRTLRDSVYAQLHRLSLAYFHRNRTGHLVSRVTNDVFVIQDVLDTTLSQMVREPLLIMVYLCLLLAISWPLTLLASVVVPVAVFAVTRLGFRLRRYSTRSQERMADVNDILEETITGMRVVKAFAMGPFEIRKFTAATGAYCRAMMKMIRVRLLATPAGEVVGACMGALVIWLGGRQVFVHQSLAPSEFITFLVLMFALGRPIKSLSDVHIKIQRGLAAADRVFEVLDTRPEVEERPDARVLPGHTDRIVFDRVWFRYETGPDVLQDISLEVRRGEVLAVVGPSGGGKSTLLDLITRFYDPTQGAIRIDGHDLRDLTVASLRACMGIVTQDVILFNDTVYRNIAYGSDGVEPERVQRAAAMANADKFIRALPEGYQTRIGQRGLGLSGGQRQRLAIARALLKNPDLLIFDEATSALDTEAELLVQEAIDRLMKNRTVFVVAHRLSTIQRADRIVVIDAGRIVEQGGHQELYRRGGLYRYLYDLQLSDSAVLREEARAG